MGSNGQINIFRYIMQFYFIPRKKNIYIYKLYSNIHNTCSPPPAICKRLRLPPALTAATALSHLRVNYNKSLQIIAAAGGQPLATTDDHGLVQSRSFLILQIFAQTQNLHNPVSKTPLPLRLAVQFSA